MNSQKSAVYFKVDLDTNADDFYQSLLNTFAHDAQSEPVRLNDREFYLTLKGSLGDIVDDSYSQGPAAAVVEDFVFVHTKWGMLTPSDHTGFLVGAAEYTSDITSAISEAKNMTTSVNYISRNKGSSGRVPRRIVKGHTPQLVTSNAV